MIDQEQVIAKVGTNLLIGADYGFRGVLADHIYGVTRLLRSPSELAYTLHEQLTTRYEGGPSKVIGGKELLREIMRTSERLQTALLECAFLTGDRELVDVLKEDPGQARMTEGDK